VRGLTVNARSVRENLVEAQEQLDEIIRDLDSGAIADEDKLLVPLQHVYFHLNFAWNTRRSPDGKVIECAQRDFDRWGKFPAGLDWAPLHRTSASSGRRKV
jgi:hypothetical protein